jgi:hypothetical protein
MAYVTTDDGSVRCGSPETRRSARSRSRTPRSRSLSLRTGAPLTSPPWHQIRGSRHLQTDPDRHQHGAEIHHHRGARPPRLDARREPVRRGRVQPVDMGGDAPFVVDVSPTQGGCPPETLLARSRKTWRTRAASCSSNGNGRCAPIRPSPLPGAGPGYPLRDGPAADDPSHELAGECATRHQDKPRP